MNHYRYLLFALILSITTNYSSAQNCNLVPPSNLKITDLTSCSATLHWSSETSVKKYLVSYRVSGTSPWSPNVSVGTTTSYEFTGLLPNTDYDFAVKSKCSDGTKSKKVKISATTTICTLPEEVIVEAINQSSGKITVTATCPYDTLYVKYFPLGGTPKTKAFPAAASYVLDGLTAPSYLIKVSTCPKGTNIWTSFDTLNLQGSAPNILLILLDDSKDDYFSCNGAPSFVHTPNIDRIANEGVNFKRTYVATSLCAPSRATIATGLFTLKTGVTSNYDALDPSFETVPKVLGANGYYTALVGKDHRTFFQSDTSEFAYVLESVGFEESEGTMYNYNGTLKNIFKEAELTFTDTAIALIERVDEPLLLWLAYRVPHTPIEPMPSFDGDYNGYVIPWKPDTAIYTVNYPSYLYGAVSADLGVLHGYTLDTTYRSALETIKGLDSCIGKIFQTLESTNKLDNTLIIFMSDNGFMMGNHWLEGKTHAYEPSMRIPLFVRYPKWFTQGTKITNQFATNMDIAPTIYDAAGVDYNGPMDGRSLRELYDGTFTRNEFYYLMLHKDQAGAPIKRAFRDQYYKYIHYNCNSDTVEEFFDMVNDPLELTNLVNKSSYQSVIEIYRAKYDSMRIAWQDTEDGTLKPCYIANPSPLKQLFEEQEILPMEPVVYPTLSTGSAELYIPWTTANVSLHDSYGNLLRKWQMYEQYSDIDLSELQSGIYFLNFSTEGKSITRKIVIVHN